MNVSSIKRHWASSVFSLALMAATISGPIAMAEPLVVGEEAPDFVLAATTGGEIRLNDFRGKKMVLIEFYHADFGPT